MKFVLSIMFLIVLISSINSQISFRTEYDSINPIKNDIEINLGKKIEIHSVFLKGSLENNNRQQQFFGYLFLLSDHMRNQDYATANKYLLKADSIASLTNNKKWQGHIWHRKAIMALRLDKLEDAREAYLASIPICGEGKDSICIGEAFEQLSYIYGYEGNFDVAKEYHDKAMPLLMKYGSKTQLAAAYNNYAIICVKTDRIEEAIELYKESIDTYKELKMTKDMSKAMNNLADAYRNQGRFNDALLILEKVININKSENLLENLYVNYQNISAVYDSIGQYEKALNYHVQFYELKDSLLGEQTKDYIAELNIKYESQKKVLELAQYKLELQKARNKSINMTLWGFGILGGALITIFFGYKKLIKNKIALIKSKNEAQELYGDKIKNIEKINNLEDIILDFKAKIHSKEVSSLKDTKHNDSTSILTDDDWIAFKNYFQNTNPGYLNKLREKYSTLSESEERLFILIKSNYTTKEIAAILGITPDSVKKTRLRLRKRILLPKSIKLDRFIKDF